jgi:protein tyrosine phosphatase
VSVDSATFVRNDGFDPSGGSGGGCVDIGSAIVLESVGSAPISNREGLSSVSESPFLSAIAGDGSPTSSAAVASPRGGPVPTGLQTLPTASPPVESGCDSTVLQRSQLSHSAPASTVCALSGVFSFDDATLSSVQGRGESPAVISAAPTATATSTATLVAAATVGAAVAALATIARPITARAGKRRSLPVIPPLVLSTESAAPLTSSHGGGSMCSFDQLLGDHGGSASPPKTALPGSHHRGFLFGSPQPLVGSNVGSNAALLHGSLQRSRDTISGENGGDAGPAMLKHGKSVDASHMPETICARCGGVALSQPSLLRRQGSAIGGSKTVPTTPTGRHLPPATAFGERVCECPVHEQLLRTASAKSLHGDDLEGHMQWPRHDHIHPGTRPGSAMGGAKMMQLLEDDMEHVEEIFKAGSSIEVHRDQSCCAREVPLFHTAQLPRNQPRNRHNNVLANEDTRVKLGSDAEYINANHVCFPGEAQQQHNYIAAQGPLPTTVADFWLMVWEQHVTVIVNLTRFESLFGGSACTRYWPTGDLPSPPAGIATAAADGAATRSDRAIDPTILRAGDFQLSMQVRRSVSATANLYTLLLTCDSQPDRSRTVHLIHETGWPDGGVPESPRALLNLVNRVHETDGDTVNPTWLVHCSAGIGRTGVFILVDIMLQQIRRGVAPNAKDILLMLRKQRFGMVQTVDQLEFCLACALEAAKSSI